MTRNKFLLKVYYDKSGKDIFGLTEPKDHKMFYCINTTDFRKTLRAVMPRGYRVKSAGWWRKYFKQYNYLKEHEFHGSLLRTRMFAIQVIDEPAKIEMELVYPAAGERYSHTLKITNQEFITENQTGEQLI